MFITINGKRYQQVPGILAIGLYCIHCHRKNQIGNSFVYTSKGMAHRRCAR